MVSWRYFPSISVKQDFLMDWGLAGNDQTWPLGEFNRGHYGSVLKENQFWGNLSPWFLWGTLDGSLSEMLVGLLKTGSFPTPCSYFSVFSLIKVFRITISSRDSGIPSCCIDKETFSSPRKVSLFIYLPVYIELYYWKMAIGRLSSWTFFCEASQQIHWHQQFTFHLLWVPFINILKCYLHFADRKCKFNNLLKATLLTVVESKLLSWIVMVLPLISCKRPFIILHLVSHSVFLPFYCATNLKSSSYKLTKWEEREYIFLNANQVMNFRLCFAKNGTDFN